MDLTKQITYNGLTLNGALSPVAGTPLSGYEVMNLSLSQIDVSAYFDKRGQIDGLDAADVYLGGRRASLIVGVFGSSLGDFWDKTQDLLSALNPTIAYDADTANLGFLPLAFYQPTADTTTWPTATYPDGIPLQYYFRPAGAPSFDIVRDADGGRATGGMSKTFVIPLIARDHRKYLQTQTTATMSTATATATYRGDYPSFPIVTFSITSAGSSAFTITIDGSAIVLNLSAAVAGTYTLNYDTKQLLDSTGASKASLFSSVTTFKPIRSGTTHSITNTSGGLTCSMTYREAFA